MKKLHLNTKIWEEIFNNRPEELNKVLMMNVWFGIAAMVVMIVTSNIYVNMIIPAFMMLCNYIINKSLESYLKENKNETKQAVVAN